MHTISEKKLLMLRPEELKTSSNQPRKSFDQYELKLLADSIQSSGIIQPLAVRKSIDGKYEIIAGERRYLAAKMVHAVGDYEVANLHLEVVHRYLVKRLLRYGHVRSLVFHYDFGLAVAVVNHCVAAFS